MNSNLSVINAYVFYGVIPDLVLENYVSTSSVLIVSFLSCSCIKSYVKIPTACNIP